MCLVCNIKKSYPICGMCSKNAFKIEKCRQLLAERKDYKKLKTLYLPSFIEIKDLNTNIFWDKKLDIIQPLSIQDGMTKSRVKQAAEFIPTNAKNILDVGAGYGFVEELLVKQQKQLSFYGFDISKEAIQNLKKRFKGEFLVGSIYNPPFKLATFDVIMALEVLEHTPPSKIFSILGSFKKLLISGGTLIISVPTNEGLRFMDHNPNGHMREYTRALITAELMLAGFEVRQYKEFFAFPSLYKIKSFLQRYILKNRWKPNDIVVQAINV